MGFEWPWVDWDCIFIPKIINGLDNNPPTHILWLKIWLISVSLQFICQINLQTPHLYIHSTPFLLHLEVLGLVCRAYGGFKRPRKSVRGPRMGRECLIWVWRALVGVDGLRWVWRAWEWCEGLWQGVEGLKWVWTALGGCGGPEMGNEGFGRYGGSDGHGWVGMGVEGVLELTWMA